MSRYHLHVWTKVLLNTEFLILRPWALFFESFRLCLRGSYRSFPTDDWELHSDLHSFSWSHFSCLGYSPSSLNVSHWLWTLLSGEKSAVHLILAPLGWDELFVSCWFLDFSLCLWHLTIWLQCFCMWLSLCLSFLDGQINVFQVSKPDWLLNPQWKLRTEETSNYLFLGELSLH